MLHAVGWEPFRLPLIAAAIAASAPIAGCGRVGYAPLAQTADASAAPPDVGENPADARLDLSSVPDGSLSSDAPAPADAPERPRDAPDGPVDAPDAGAADIAPADAERDALADVRYTGRVNDCQLFTYQGRAYAQCTTPAGWAAARMTCNALGMDLVTLDDETEEAVLGQVAGGGDYWIGLNDQANENVFVWASGASAYRHWQPEEPNDAAGNEDCVYARGSIGWNDSPCAFERKYICERP